MQSDRKKKILVTGAQGFIGSHVTAYLRNNGYEVYGCGRTRIKHQDAGYVECDLTKETLHLHVDVMIHTAAIGPHANASFNDYFNNNVMATRNILEYAERCHCHRILYMAAVSSYGKVDGVLREDSPHNDTDDYGLTKYIAEMLVKNSEVPQYTLILPGVVGDGCGDNWIMKAGKTICSGNDFTYYNGQGLFNNIAEIEDICKFIEVLIERESADSASYLLGSRETMTIHEIVSFLKDRFLSDSKLYDSKGTGNSFYLDISKALSAGFRPKPLTEILEEVCRIVCNKGKEHNR